MTSRSRNYDRVQAILTKHNEAGKPVTTAQIQKLIFGREFHADSRSQRDQIYYNVITGRSIAIRRWAQYIESPEYMSDLAQAEHYKSKRWQDQVMTDDYKDFETELHMGLFGENGKIVKDNIPAFSLIATVWEDKLAEWSKAGDNLVIASLGPGSGWILPSWWRWSVREKKLYLGSLNRVIMQLTRGDETKQLTASGQPIRKAIGYIQSARGMLTNQTSWNCPNCQMFNEAQANFCSNCGMQNPKPIEA